MHVHVHFLYAYYVHVFGFSISYKWLLYLFAQEEVSKLEEQLQQEQVCYLHPWTSLVSRPLPAFQRSQEKPKGPWYATAHDWRFTRNRPGIDLIMHVVRGSEFYFLAYPR